MEYYINAKITETKLGCLHDRGIMTFWIMLEFGSGGQGLGGYAMDSYCKTAQNRLQTSLTGEVVHGILSALELDSWEDLKVSTFAFLWIILGLDRKSLESPLS